MLQQPSGLDAAGPSRNPASILDPIVHRLAKDTLRTGQSMTLQPPSDRKHIGPEKETGTEALETIRSVFERRRGREKYHLGVIHGVGRYIAGIGPFALHSHGLSITGADPFLYICGQAPQAN